jgi:hypothetical protein
VPTVLSVLMIMKSLGVLSIILSLVLVYLFFKVYRLQRSVILLGLPLGFLFLTVSFSLLGVHLFAFTTIIDSFTSSIMWFRVVTQTLGFTLIALSYFFSGQSQKETKHNISLIALCSFVSILCIFGVLLILYPAGLFSIYSYTTLFTIANIGLLSYIIFFILRRLAFIKENFDVLASTIVAFGFIWLGQYSFLICKLDYSDVSLLGSQFAPIIGLALFIRVYYLTSKRCHQQFDD